MQGVNLNDRAAPDGPLASQPMLVQLCKGAIATSLVASSVGAELQDSSRAEGLRPRSQEVEEDHGVSQLAACADGGEDPACLEQVPQGQPGACLHRFRPDLASWP